MGDWSAISHGIQVSESPIDKITTCYKLRCEDGTSVFFKRYVYRPGSRMRYWCRPSRAACEVYGYRELSRLSVETLEVLAFGEERQFGALYAAYIVTKGIENSIDISKYARETWYQMPKAKRQKVYLDIREQLIGDLKRLHAARFFHRDLHWRNLLITTEGQAYKIIWIDCPRAAYHRISWRHARMVDLSYLARLALSYLTRSERYRALRHYLGANAHKREVSRLFCQIEAHHRRSRHPPKLLNLPPRKK